MVALALVVAFSFAALIPIFDSAQLAGCLHDDAFYYFQVAKNAARGHGFTFDRIHLTNGFQPLWELILVSLFGLVPGFDAPLRVVLALQTGLIVAAVLLIHRTLLGRIGRWAAAAGALAVVALPAARPILRSGMESSLLLLLLVLVWRAWLEAESSPPGAVRPFLVLGCFLALAFVARLEALVAAPIVALLAQARLRREPRASAALAVPPTMVAAAYFAWNRLLFETWIPVSGMIKKHLVAGLPWSNRLDQMLDLPWLGQSLICLLFGRPSGATLPPIGKIVNIGLMVLVVAIGLNQRHVLVAAIRRAGVALPVMVSIGMVALDKVTLFFIPRWGEVPFLLLTGCIAAALLGLEATPTWLVKGLTVLLAILCLVRVPDEWNQNRDIDRRYAPYRVAAGRWVRANVPPEARIGSWNAGTFAYFADRHVINLDGLVNDVEFYRLFVSPDSLDDYFAREGITWLADQGCGNLRPKGYLSRTGSQHLDQRFETVAHLYYQGNDRRCPGFAVWKLTEIAASGDSSGSGGGR